MAACLFTKQFLRLVFVCLILSVPAACNQTREDAAGDVKKQEFNVRSLAKTDINRMMDIYLVEIRAQLRLLMEKLYKRNPRELKKSPYHTADENIQRLFSRTNNWFFRDLDDKYGVAAIELSFSRDYPGDRVFAFVAGLTSMIMTAYNNKTEFYVYDDIDPQALYNSARNIEIAAWKLDNSRDSNGDMLLYGNSRPNEQSNHSYASLFGRLTVLQDTMAVILANKSNRTISKVIQRLATAVFLPIP